MISYNLLHVMFKRATQAKFSTYKLPLLLHKTINEEIPKCDWLSIYFEETFTSRQSTFNIYCLKEDRKGFFLNPLT
jgi:hypothetical protein